MMKSGVPAFNCLLAIIYFLAAGALLFLLKTISKTRKKPTSSKSSEQTSQLTPSFKMLGTAWFKKYTLASIFCSQDGKYFLKQGFILSAYAVACFNINTVIVWPITFSLFLLPITILLFQVIIKKAWQSAQQKQNNGEVMNVIDERQIQIENVGIEIKKRKKESKKSTDMLEIGIATGMTFAGIVMCCQCSMQLANSISNSGQLNILSLLAMIPIDQLLIRPMTGLTILLTLKILEMRQKINISTNIFVLYLCEEQIQKLRDKIKKGTLKMADDITASPLKKQESHIKGKIEIQSEFIDLDHLQPECHQKQEELIQNNQLEAQTIVEQKHQPKYKPNKQLAQLYLTTPQKELFEGTQSQHSQQTIIETAIVQKQNTEPEINFSRQSDSIDIKHFDEFMLDRDPLQAFTNEIIVPRRKNARKNKRVLKLSGNSPYLEYLPNMLKKVENYKHLLHSQRQPKML